MWKGDGFTLFWSVLLDVILYNNLSTKNILKSVMTFVHNWLSFPQVKGDIEHNKGISISKLSFPDSPSLGRWGSNHMGPKFGKKDKLGLGKCHLGKYLYFAIFINNFSCYIVQLNTWCVFYHSIQPKFHWTPSFTKITIKLFFPQRSRRFC